MFLIILHLCGIHIFVDIFEQYENMYSAKMSTFTVPRYLFVPLHDYRVNTE